MKYEFDADYKQMYLYMFNAATDAVNEILRFNMGNAARILIAAQAKCEDMFIESDIDDETEDFGESFDEDDEDDSFEAFMKKYIEISKNKREKDN